MLIAASAQAGLTDAQVIGLAGKCLDVRGGGTADGTAVVLFRCQDNPNQRWDLPPRAFSGEIRGLGDKCLDVTGGVSQDRATVEIRSCSGAPSQQWRFGRDGRIVGIGERCLDVLDADPSDLAQVGIFACHGGANQLWRPYARNHFLPTSIDTGAYPRILRIAPAAPRSMFVEAEQGLFRSEDGGESWSSLVDVLARPRASLQALDAHDPNLLYVLLSGIRRSEDGGRSWAALEPPLDFLADSLVADPRREAGLYGVDRRGATWRSLDAGRSWTALGSLPVGQNTIYQARIYPDPNSGANLYATALALIDGNPFNPIGTFKSTDGGGSWRQVEGACVFGRIFVDPHDSRWLYGLCGEGLQRSSDRGETWAEISPVNPLRSRGLLVDRASPGRLLLAHAGGTLFASTDRGASWLALPFPETWGTAALELLAASGDGQSVFAGVEPFPPTEAQRGLYRSTDWGGSWQRTGRGLDEPRLFGVVPDPTRPGRAYAYGPDGLYVTADGAVTWERRTEIPYRALAVDPHRPDRVIAGTNLGLVYRSSDAGRSFQSSSLPDGIFSVGAIAYNPAVAGTIVAIGLMGGSDARILRSHDDGASWQDLFGADGLRRLAIDAGGQRIYAFASFESLAISTDGGTSWSARGLSVSSLAADPVVAGTSWAVSDDRLLVSHDGFDTWTTVGLPDAVVTGLLQEVSVADGAVVLTTGGADVWRSIDGGASWSDVAAGLPAGQEPNVAIDPNQTERLWAVGRGNGVYVGDFDLTLPPAGSTLGLVDHRFELSVTWRDFQGNVGAGTAVSLTNDTGAFWFFSPANLELMVKVLDGREINGHFWVFYGALSNVEFTLTVRDTATGQERVYVNPLGKFASRGDTEAF